MPRIVAIRLITSIKPGTPPQVAPNGTILNPIPYDAVNVTFADGITVQVERPCTIAKVQAAWRAARQAASLTVDDITTDQDIPP